MSYKVRIEARFISGHVEHTLITSKKSKGQTVFYKKVLESWNQIFDFSRIENDEINEWIFFGDFSERFRDIIDNALYQFLKRYAPDKAEKYSKFHKNYEVKREK